MVEVEVKVEKSVRILRSAAGKIEPTAKKEIEHGLEDIVIWLKGEVQQRTPVSGGPLKNEMNAEVRWEGLDLMGIINNPLNYARVIETGRTSNKMPPSDALRAWARKKLGDERLAFVVARAIAKRGGFVGLKHGDRAQMFGDAFDENLDALERRLKDIGLDVSQAVEYLFEG